MLYLVKDTVFCLLRNKHEVINFYLFIYGGIMRYIHKKHSTMYFIALLLITPLQNLFFQ